MTYFLGEYGKIKLKRNSVKSFSSSVRPADVNVSLSRFGFDGSEDNLITGDQIRIVTQDSRGLDFLPASTWPDGGGATLDEIVAYANVNAVGGIRFFETFSEAINNDRNTEYAVEAFTGDPIDIDIQIKGSIARLLGDVTGFTFNTDRESMDTTTMSDRFRKMYSAGIISGSGSIDCLFNTTNSGVVENSLLMLQLINRTDIGSEFSCFLQLTEGQNFSTLPEVYYAFEAMITKTGVEVQPDQAIRCAIDFVTTGEIRLVVGKPPGFTLVTEDDDALLLQQDLDLLLTEVAD